MVDNVVLESFYLSDERGDLVRVTPGSRADLKGVDSDINESEEYSAKMRVKRERRILGDGL